MKSPLPKLSGGISRQRLLLALALGFLAGALWMVGLRFFMVRSDSVHYHANFALYVNGQQDKFDNFGFYEEVASCGGNDKDNPKIRVHLHDSPNHGTAHVVHVHDQAATWGHLFANLGYTLGNNVIKTDAGVFVNADAAGSGQPAGQSASGQPAAGQSASGQSSAAGAGAKLRFYLNGEEVPAAANRTINDRDVLLVAYGTENAAALQKYFNAIPKDADKFNATSDPAACSGQEPTLDWPRRLKRALDFTN